MIQKMGGRKLVLGIAFLGCSTFIVYGAVTGTHAPDLFGLASVIGAMAVGVGAIVYGNVREHEAKK